MVFVQPDQQYARATGIAENSAIELWIARAHNVVKGRPYPAVLMTTGENDPRVDPYNSRKMVALLQADSSSPYPELLIQRSGQVHGAVPARRGPPDESPEAACCAPPLVWTLRNSVCYTIVWRTWLVAGQLSPKHRPGSDQREASN
jgi:hypothetical protein